MSSLRYLKYLHGSNTSATIGLAVMKSGADIHRLHRRSTNNLALSPVQV